jgi:RHS repeat-associated protein
LIFDKDSQDGDGVCDNERYFYCRQANFNVVAVTSDAGAIMDRINYDPYGEPTLVVDGSTGNPYLFQGRRWDSDADLYYFRNRDYDPELGRFMQRDPLGYVGGMNLYQFVEGRPVQASDPFGQDPVAVAVALTAKATAAGGPPAWAAGAVFIVGAAVGALIAEATGLDEKLGDAIASAASDFQQASKELYELARAKEKAYIASLMEAYAVARECVHCRIMDHPPHHNFSMSGKPCFKRHLQLNCWVPGIAVSGITFQWPYGKCLPYSNR